MLRLYVDHGSQPSRAVMMFVRENNIKHEEKLVHVAKGETRSPEFTKINPAQEVPVIDDDGVVIAESHAILRYLAQKHRVPDHWYPADLAQRAKVDSVLDWHHTHLRAGAARTFRYLVLFPMLKPGYEPQADKLSEARHLLTKSLKTMDYWLSQRPYIATDAFSIADLSLSCELMQLVCLKENPLTPYPRIQKWLRHLTALPSFPAVHKILLRIAERVGGIGLPALLGDAATPAAVTAPAASAPAASAAAVGPDFKSAKVFAVLRQRIEAQGAELVNKVKAVYQFNITSGGVTKSWVVDLKNGSGSVTEGAGKADTTLTVSDADFVALNTGKLDSQMAFLQGKLKIAGSMGHAMKLGSVLTPIPNL